MISPAEYSISSELDSQIYNLLESEINVVGLNMLTFLQKDLVKYSIPIIILLIVESIFQNSLRGGAVEAQYK